MKRTFILSDRRLTKQGPCKGLLTNGRGSYFILNKESSYRGWVILKQNDWRMLKILDDLEVMESGQCKELGYQQFNLQRKFEDGTHDAISMYGQVLLYNHVRVKKLKLILDHREIFEESKFGRNYKIKQEKEYVVIEFKKTTTKQEDDNDEEYDHYIVIKGFKEFNTIGNWVEKTFDEDKERNSRNKYWVYEAGIIIPKNHLVLAQADSLEEAKIRADTAYANFDSILNDQHEKSLREKITPPSEMSSEEQIAFILASNSLRTLTQTIGDLYVTKGIFAGYPWFFQLWSRDELTSLGGLITLAKKYFQKNKDEKKSLLKRRKQKTLHYVDDNDIFTIYSILKRHIQSIQADGLLENRFPKSEIGSIDSIGWLAKRIIDFVNLLKDEDHLHNVFSINELIEWKTKLFRSLEKVKESRLGKNGLFKNNPQETWMDTIYHDSGRSGYRIEIQALFYNLYSAIILLDKLTDNKLRTLIDEQKEFRKKIRLSFIKKNSKGNKITLLDGIEENLVEDKTVRPNTFIALYLAPEIFSSKERKKIITEHLERLFLPWGGLSSIDKQSSLFQPKHTGHDTASYHRGDSWFFVNNIAGIVLLNEGIEFEKEYKKIFEAGIKDILEHGFAGHMSELSSASIQDASGCFAQAWSVGTFLEFCDRLFPEDF